MIYLRGKLFCFVALLLLPPMTPSYADANLMAFPNMVIFEGTDRYNTINVINKGDATGLFSIAWVDNIMLQDGTLQRLEAGTSPHSIQPYIRSAPRRIMLAPGERQIIKISVRRKIDVPDGEYFSHIQIRTLDGNVEASTLAASKNQKTTTQQAAIKPRMGLAFPVIWRNGANDSTASLTSAEINAAENSLTIKVRRHGAFSTRGYVSVFTEHGDQSIADRRHVAIYANLDEKIVTIMLKKGISAAGLAGKSLRIVYSDENDNDQVFFDRVVSP